MTGLIWLGVGIIIGLLSGVLAVKLGLVGRAEDKITKL
jgi:hypothetical protein